MTVQRESGDGPMRDRGSKESQERVQRVLGEGPKRVEECPKRVRRGSIESQETVRRESGDGPKRVRRRSR